VLCKAVEFFMQARHRSMHSLAGIRVFFASAKASALVEDAD
jgi:hypothetical protein